MKAKSPFSDFFPYGRSCFPAKFSFALSFVFNIQIIFNFWPLFPTLFFEGSLK